MLTPYDEFPVHQASRPFSYIPSTDYSWDDGYFFGAFSADEGVFLATGVRVNPNTDMIGGYAMLNVRGQQHTVRFNRCWRPNFDLEVGPWRLDVIEPLKSLRISLGENESPIAFDILWEGVSPAYLEEHHVATHRGRRTTDQTRYSQPGQASGSISLAGQSWAVTPQTWTGSRDHSWGLYAERAPLAPKASVLPPRQPSDLPSRAFRFWICFKTGEVSGFYHLHETAAGLQCEMNDVFGTPFGGRVFHGWDMAVELAGGSHRITFEPGTRLMKSAVIDLVDVEGGKWRQEIDVAAPPWAGNTLGYHPGSWKDGGTFFTYHGSESLALEWDSFDLSRQPAPFRPYAVNGEDAANMFGEGSAVNDTILGTEYLVRIRTIAPNGHVSHGEGHIELFINGAFAPYGFA